MTNSDLTGKIITAQCTRALRDMEPDHADAWTDWLKQHQLDVNRILVDPDSEIRVDYDARTITATKYVPDGGSNADAAAHVVELDQTPAPFPPHGLPLVVQESPTSSEDRA